MRISLLIFVVIAQLGQEVKSDNSRALCSKRKYVDGKQNKQIMFLKTKANDYGLVNEKEYLAGKPSNDFEYLQVAVQFGAYWFYKKVSATALGIPDDDKWHQLWFDLEPSDAAGLDDWHVHINVDGKSKVDIDTGYKWHWSGNHPKSFYIFAAGKSTWIPKANATVCNIVEQQDTTSSDTSTQQQPQTTNP
ncbi:unnamed protein product [Meganyctiphanes norvegica]|uniref:Uncharacterized protein n=1 Tax=Meganyctiphanes norvegica TaxID=48144 RepID=A0AAV2QI61_MEGNR